MEETNNKELYDLCSLPNIVWVMKSRTLLWSGYVVHMGAGEVHTGFWWGDLVNRDYVKDLGVDGKIMLKWDGQHGLDCCGLG